MRAVIAALGFAVVIAGIGCDQEKSAPVSQNVNAPADNTKTNQRDRGTDALTPVDQGGNEIDRTITQRIRQGVMNDDALSFTAKNVKIITVDGVVTLRGPVKSDHEKDAIAALAQQTGNVKRVDNQLEIASN